MKLVETQTGLMAIANHLEAGTLPEVLDNVRTIRQFNDILHRWNYQETTERTELLRIMDTSPVFIDPVALEIREAEEALFGQKIPGFFPTPRELADRMVSLASVRNDMEVLEPSAGKGDIAEAILRHCSEYEIEVDLTCIETNYQLCQILELKGFQYAQADFLDVRGTGDRIIMNPPFRQLKRDKAPGVDGQTVGQYAENLEPNLQDLALRLHRQSYLPQPSLRRDIPKGNGKTRPLGIACVEDKIVQRAVVMILERIYEVDFCDTSYGFRPDRSCLQALSVLGEIIATRKVNWISDADIKGFFDNVNHQQLVAIPRGWVKGLRARSTSSVSRITAAQAEQASSN